MARSAILLVLAVVGFFVWAAKQATGHGSDDSVNDEVKKTIRKTSRWIDDLKNEWEDNKRK